MPMGTDENKRAIAFFLLLTLMSTDKLFELYSGRRCHRKSDWDEIRTVNCLIGKPVWKRANWLKFIFTAQPSTTGQERERAFSELLCQFYYLQRQLLSSKVTNSPKSISNKYECFLPYIVTCFYEKKRAELIARSVFLFDTHKATVLVCVKIIIKFGSLFFWHLLICFFLQLTDHGRQFIFKIFGKRAWIRSA